MASNPAKHLERIARRLVGTASRDLVRELLTVADEIRDTPRQRLTPREAQEVLALLNIVLTNDDQWTMMDLAALRRAAKKLEGE